MFNALAKVFTKIILLSIKVSMMATLPPSIKLVLIFRREKGKRSKEAILFLEIRDSDVIELHGLEQIKESFAICT